MPFEADVTLVPVKWITQGAPAAGGQSTVIEICIPTESLPNIPFNVESNGPLYIGFHRPIYDPEKSLIFPSRLYGNLQVMSVPARKVKRVLTVLKFTSLYVTCEMSDDSASEVTTFMAEPTHLPLNVPPGFQGEIQYSKEQ